MRAFDFFLLLCVPTLVAVSAAASSSYDGTASSDVLIESFSSPRLDWKTRNDPVMGGQSTASFTLQKDVGIFEGDVKIVPFLKAPGFIKLEGKPKGSSFPDVSALKFVARSTTSDYQGYRVSFGTQHNPATKMPFIGGFKAHFFLEPSTNTTTKDNSFQELVIPFDNFTVDWDPATGDALVSCQDNPKYCPDSKTLENMQVISFMGEGVEGHVHLELQSISATQCSNAMTAAAGVAHSTTASSAITTARSSTSSSSSSTTTTTSLVASLTPESSTSNSDGFRWEHVTLVVVGFAVVAIVSLYVKRQEERTLEMAYQAIGEHDETTDRHDDTMDIYDESMETPPSGYMLEMA